MHTPEIPGKDAMPTGLFVFHIQISSCNDTHTCQKFLYTDKTSFVSKLQNKSGAHCNTDSQTQEKDAVVGILEK